MNRLVLLLLAGCGDLVFELVPPDAVAPVDTAHPEAPDTAGSEADADVDTDTDADTDADTDTDAGEDSAVETGVARAHCRASRWSWGAHNTAAQADASFVGRPGPGPVMMRLMSPGDMSGDGLADLVVGATLPGATGEMRFVLGPVARVSGQPLHGLPSLVGNPGEELINASAVGDIDADGLADIVAEDRWLVLGRSIPGMDAASPVNTSDARVSNPGAGRTPYRRFGDVDRDGHDDWLITDATANGGEVQVISGARASGPLALPASSAWWLFGGSLPVRFTGFGDFDGDGVSDLIAEHDAADRQLIVFGADVGTSRRAPVPEVSTTSFVFSTAMNGLESLPDLDGDGDDEAIVWFRDLAHRASWGLYLFRRADRWGPGMSIHDADVVIGAGEYVDDATWLGDLDGDGLSELGVRHDPTETSASFELYIYFGREHWPAALTLADADVHISRAGGLTHSLRFPDLRLSGDLDGDGFDDLLVRSPSVEGTPDFGRIYVFLGRARWPSQLTTADADVRFAGPDESQRITDDLVLADLDGDGCDDLVSAAGDAVLGTAVVSVHFGQSRRDTP